MLSDEEYFNRKATVLEYDRTVLRGEAKKPQFVTTDPNQLYKEARETVGDISFIEISNKYPDLFEIHDKKETIIDLGIASFIGLLSFTIGDIFVGAAGKNKPWAELSDINAEQNLLAYAKKTAGEKGIPKYTKNGEYIGETKSAIRFLENKYAVTYDQAKSFDVGDSVKGMTMSNHHFYSASHNPGLGGLFSAVKDQFLDTSTFIQPGTGDIIVTLGTGAGQKMLAGKGTVGKIIAGFGNWYGHNLSDISGGSGAVGRGSGLPIPMMQYMSRYSGKLGMSGFSELLCKVYEQGYDYRFGKASYAPILINDTLTRIIWAVKHYSKTGDIKNCVPACFPVKGKEHYDLSNMLLMSNAAFLACDTGHAALKSHGDPITFLCNCNLKEWFNFAIAFSRDFFLTIKRTHDVKKAGENYLDETSELYASMKWN